MHVGLEHYLMVSAALFCLGVLGVVLRRNLLVMYMGLELMLNAANLALVSFSRFNNNLNGQIMVFFIITVAAAEVESITIPSKSLAAKVRVVLWTLITSAPTLTFSVSSTSALPEPTT